MKQGKGRLGRRIEIRRRTIKGDEERRGEWDWKTEEEEKNKGEL